MMIAFVALAAIAGPHRADGSDTIYFKDGMRTVCEGSAWEKNDEIHCEYDGGLLIYPKSDVDRIEKGRSRETENNSKKPEAVESLPSRQTHSIPSPIPGPAASAAANRPSGIAFYDPRRPKKYWSSETRHHDTFRDAISALAEEFERPAAWIEQNMGESNNLGDVRETLGSRLSGSVAGTTGAGPETETEIEFYNPRRPHKYMTGPDAKHNSFKEALEALAQDFERPADWIERNMGESNDVNEIRQNLRSARDVESAQ